MIGLKRVTFKTFRFYSTSKPFDLVVVGGGPGGYVAAIKAAQLGLNTACVEKRGTLGGTCLNVGCIPSKALLHNSHLFHIAKHEFNDRGIDCANVAPNLLKMMKHKEKSVEGLTKGIEMLFKKNKVEYFKGIGSFISKNQIQVNDNNGKNNILDAKNILIATGSEPISIPNIKIDEKTIVTSTGALSLSEIPKKMVVIGGGVIGLELGSVWSRLGAEVTVVEFLGNIGGSAMDLQASTAFQKILTKQGMNFKLGAKVTGVATSKQGAKVNDTEHIVSIDDGKNKSQLHANVVLVAVGRRSFTDKLGLEKAGVQVDEKGRVKIDKHFKTNIPNIYAIGDVVAGPMLAHKAEEEGIAVAEQLAGGYGHVNYEAIPSVIY
ncbi:FAD-dependent pyridine nucleotide-disulfide oxidoreductase, partial [Rozella allomycis CSF55]